jgi:hypothetical protein
MAESVTETIVTNPGLESSYVTRSGSRPSPVTLTRNDVVSPTAPEVALGLGESGDTRDGAGAEPQPERTQAALAAARRDRVGRGRQIMTDLPRYGFFVPGGRVQTMMVPQGTLFALCANSLGTEAKES